METETIYLIECRTGCTCCSSDNHYRGPYTSKEAAEQRIKYFLSPESKFWPLASQYARRGSYHVKEMQMERLPDGRVIIDDHVYEQEPSLIDPNTDGSLNNNSLELSDISHPGY